MKGLCLPQGRQDTSFHQLAERFASGLLRFRVKVYRVLMITLENVQDKGRYLEQAELPCPQQKLTDLRKATHNLAVLCIVKLPLGKSQNPRASRQPKRSDGQLRIQ